MKRTWRHGNLAHVCGGFSMKKSHDSPILANCITSYQDPKTGFYRVNCVEVRRSTPYQDVQVIGLVKPLPNSMGLLFFADGDSTLPFYFPCGY